MRGRAGRLSRCARLALLALLPAAPALLAGPHGKVPVPLRDLKPRFVKGRSPLYRSRTPGGPGLMVGGKRYRGLNLVVPGRAGFDIDGHFARLEVKVGVVDGSLAPARFRILGDGQPLAATPPLFAGAKPLPIEVALNGVVLLELVVEGTGAVQGAWVDGRLFGAAGKDLANFRPASVPFSARDYPSSFRRRVNTAIDKGVAHLLLQQRSNGTWTSRYHQAGTTALVTLALLKGGVRPDDPSIVKAFEYLRQYRYDHVYSVACLLMALEARYFPEGADPRRARREIPAEDQAWIRAAAQWLVDQRGAGFRRGERDRHPIWRYPAGGYDLSNTQYALFGLAAANRCGVRFKKVWLPALRYVISAQEKKGPAVEVSRYFRMGDFYRRRTERAQARGFAYQLTGRRTGSMTTAGLCALILCDAALRGTVSYEGGWRGRTRIAIRDALAWIEEYYDVDRNPFRGTTWWAYYLFNLERVGVLLDQRYLGTRDWYEEGSERLMATQEADGRLAGNTINTAFALLFLKRATVSPLTQTRR